MNDSKKNPKDPFSQQEDHTPPPSDPSQVISPGRRTALVTYLAILFAVAFLFVALTMAMESKRLKTVNEALQDSSEKTSASLTGSINALQQENKTLLDDKASLEEQLAALQAELQSAQQNAEEREQSLSALLDQLTTDKQALEVAQAELKTQLESANKRAQDAIDVSELLQKAVVLNEEGNMDELSTVLQQIAPLRELLSPSEAELYESLQID